MRTIYLDNNASTPVDAPVVAAMVAALEHLHGNPSSHHPPGEEARAAVEEARASVARLVGARSSDEIVFTSGGTESANLAIHGALAGREGGIVLTSTVEHPCVSKPLERWRERGTTVELVPVDPEGRLQTALLLERLQAARGTCRLVSLILANNETGVCLPSRDVASIAEACRRLGVPFHLDAVQAAGKLRLDLAELGADLLSLSAHKFHGPKGAGALFVRAELGERFPALLLGGPQEAGHRAGTSNVPGIVGLGKAAELALRFLADEPARARSRELAQRLERGLRAGIEGAVVHGERAERLWNTTSLRLRDVDGDLFLAALAAEGICVSGGAACSSGRRAPSGVLMALGLTPDEARATIRLSVSRLTRADEVELALERIPAVVKELRGLATHPVQ